MTVVRWPVGFVGALARNGRSIEGRAIFATSVEWTRDYRSGYIGYDYNATTKDEHDLTLAAALAWLCQSAGSVNVLICQPDPTPAGYDFGAQFQAGLGRLGHSFQLTGGTGFGSYDPTDFDAVLCESRSPWANDAAVDAFLDANGKLWSTYNSGASSTLWERYGFKQSGFQTNSNSGASWLRAFTCAPWGAGTYRTTLFWDVARTYNAGDKTRPGTSTLITNDLGQGNYGLWTAS